MKWIKKDKIFGVLNTLDIVIILFILALVVPAVHYYIKFNDKSYLEEKAADRYIKQKMRDNAVTQVKAHEVDFELYVSFKNLNEAALKKIKLHDRELAPDGAVMAEILWLGEPQPNYFYVLMGDRVYSRTMPEKDFYSLPAKLRVRGIVTDMGNFLFKGKAIYELNSSVFNPKGYAALFVIETSPFLEYDYNINCPFTRYDRIKERSPESI